ncbi:MAG: hypothetical protein VB102_10210 [Paludibacter sp.]|nr:hypothetical protein [Paludibacter sp.]
MKAKKIIITACVVILCAELLFAQKPTDKGNKTNLEDLIVSKLNADVQLTDSQKKIIKERAKAFVSKSNAVSSKATAKENFDIKKQASEEYEIFLDSILTGEQKGQKAFKMQQRAANACRVK